MTDSFIWPFLVYLAAVLGLVITMLALSAVLGQKRLDPATLAPFESGIVPAGDSNMPGVSRVLFGRYLLRAI